MKKKILVADDNKDIVIALSMMLEDAGYEVRSISNEQIVQVVENYLPDLLLLDILMVDIDGRNICKYLKNQQLTKHIPVIMVSANRNTEKIAHEAGANDFITKPFDMDELLGKVAQYT